MQFAPTGQRVRSGHQWVLALLFIGSTTVSGCSRNDGVPTKVTAAGDSPRVIAVSYALKSFAEELLGDISPVAMPDYGGVNPLHWRPSTNFIRQLQRAELILCNGSGAQVAPWMNTIAVAPSKLIETIENIRLEDFLVIYDAPTHSHGPEGEHSHSGLIATTWLDPRIAKDQADFIAIRLQQHFPDRATTIQQNEQRLRNKFDELTAEIEKFEQFRGKYVLSSEPSFKYLMRRLGIEDKHYFWSQEKGDIEAAHWQEFDATRPESARIMLWPLQPSSDVLEQLQARSIEVLVLDLLIDQPTGSGNYFDSIRRNIRLLAERFQE